MAPAKNAASEALKHGKKRKRERDDDPKPMPVGAPRTTFLSLNVTDIARKKEYPSKDKEIQQLRNQLRERDTKMDDLKKQLDWALSLVSLRDQVDAQNQTIADMQRQIDELKVAVGGVADCEKRVRDQEEFAADLQGQVCDHAEEIGKLQGQVTKVKRDQLDKLLGKTIKEFLG